MIEPTHARTIEAITAARDALRARRQDVATQTQRAYQARTDQVNAARDASGLAQQ